MTTDLLARVPVDKITERAREVRPGHTILTVIAGVLFGAGWVTAKAFKFCWFAFTWCWAAVGTGWQAAHGPSRAQQIADLHAQIEALSAQVHRLGGP